MAHFHTFIPSEPGFDYSDIQDYEFGQTFINEMKRIEDYTDREVEREFNKKMKEQWVVTKFTVSRNKFWTTYKPVRDFLEEHEFTVNQKRALLMFLHQRDAIFQQIESGKLSYVRGEGQRYVRNNIIDILSGREIPKRSESEEKAKAKKTKARKREAEENKIIKSMTKRDLTPSQRKDIEEIEKLEAKIVMEAKTGQKVPHLVKNWWKQADLDKFLEHKKNKLINMEIQNENSGDGEGGYCTLM